MASDDTTGRRRFPCEACGNVFAAVPGRKLPTKAALKAAGEALVCEDCASELEAYAA
jgi:hypothetical protein